jgi:transcriptional regulator GlxA family with amidase domain
MLDSANAEWISAQPGRLALLERLRQALAVDPAMCASIQHMAKHLAVSTRTLQRRLSESRTTFRQEVALAKVRSAQRLLVQTDLSVTRIAIHVGFASSQSFARQFARFTGNSPGRFRGVSALNREQAGCAENGASGNAERGRPDQDDW